ncbi:MAG TPA: tripartite tricarboxylate transporter substrate binding protein [Xanthobacteraceae bacterium]|jgi:tripartite-type tricarboxylate transporter receptor subunit TctC|nr:tripartite tricarboxylate transporter substrate binding protein [Xanthobacteraceae bacterium]
MMRQPLRKVLIAVALGVGTLAPGMVVAQSPNQVPASGQVIKFLVTHPAGGLPDTVARIVARRMQERMGQAIAVENRSGANGGIAVSALTSAPADGQTFVVTDGAILSINPQLYGKLPYEPKNVAPVAFLATAPLFLAVHPKVPVSNVKEFVDYVKARPGQLNYGSSGVGSIHHISMEGLKHALQLDITHVPYKGTGESVPALLGGHVETLFSALPSLSGAAGTDRVKLLASNGVGRSAQAPNLPALSEFIPGFNFASIVGIYARVGLPPAIMQKIAAEAIAVLKEPEVIKALAVVGVDPAGGGPEDFARALQGQTERVAKVVQAVGIKGE